MLFRSLLSLYSDKPMLVETIDRVSELVPLERTYIVAGEALSAAIASAVPGLAGDRILAEPVARNTAMAIGLAAAMLWVLRRIKR